MACQEAECPRVFDAEVRLRQLRRPERVSEHRKYARKRPGGPKEFSPGRQPWVQKALLFAGAPAGRKKRSRRGHSPRFCRPFRSLTGAWAWFPGLAPWAKFYRPLGGLPGPLCCCRRKLSQICHAPAAGLPLLCRTPISCRVMSPVSPRLFYLGSSYSPSIS